MKTIEIWKDIPEYEGYYQASTLGRIKSLDREVKHCNNSLKKIKGQLLTPQLSETGYLRIILKIDKGFKTYKIHRLIAATFLNYDLNDKSKVVNHINFIRTDNKLVNLEVITQRENSSKKHLKSASKYTGVYKYSKNEKWVARIFINNKNYSLGSFNIEEEANDVYQIALENYLEKGTIPYKRSNSSRYKGVTWDKNANKWKSRPTINGKQIHLGMFSSEEEAYQAILKFKN